jgi:hypothetical protein
MEWQANDAGIQEFHAQKRMIRSSFVTHTMNLRNHGGRYSIFFKVTTLAEAYSYCPLCYAADSQQHFLSDAVHERMKYVAVWRKRWGKCYRHWEQTIKIVKICGNWWRQQFSQWGNMSSTEDTRIGCAPCLADGRWTCRQTWRLNWEQQSTTPYGMIKSDEARASGIYSWMGIWLLRWRIFQNMRGFIFHGHGYHTFVYLRRRHLISQCRRSEETPLTVSQCSQRPCRIMVYKPLQYDTKKVCAKNLLRILSNRSGKRASLVEGSGGGAAVSADPTTQ